MNRWRVLKRHCAWLYRQFRRWSLSSIRIPAEAGRRENRNTQRPGASHGIRRKLLAHARMAPPHEEMDQRAIACFDQALQDTGFDQDERLRRVLHDYFALTTTTTMAHYHASADDVPDGLHIPKWSWNGLVSE